MSTQAFSLRPSGHLRRRRLIDKAMSALATAAAALAIFVLVIVVVSVARRGVGALSVAFFTKAQEIGFQATGGGVAFAIVGSAILVGIATAIALPLGVLAALYLGELAPPSVARVVRLAFDTINGIPTIVIGIFVFALVVSRFGQSGLAGSFALAIIMLPLVARATEEVLLLVPKAQREASLALGVSRWRTTFGVVLPAALGGILTGTTLAIARAAGETAPLLFTSSLGNASEVSLNPLKPLYSLTQVIFQYSDQPDASFQAKAWAAAFTLMCFVLFTNLAAKLALARYRRKFGG
jgi:phosphate transport system permease protein